MDLLLAWLEDKGTFGRIGLIVEFGFTQRI